MGVGVWGAVGAGGGLGRRMLQDEVFGASGGLWRRELGYGSAGRAVGQSRGVGPRAVGQ